MARHRIQSVVEQTGVSASTLRAWERRYGIPNPERTTSSYRLYTDRDVELVRTMRDLCAAGTPASEAARMASARISSVAAERAQRDPFAEATSALLGAVHRFDPAEFEQGLQKVLMLGSASEIYEQTISPLLHEIGSCWERQELSVAQEHTFSQILDRTLSHLFRLLQPADSQRTVVLACFAEEQHAFGLYGVAFRLAGWGYRTISLGARTPPEAVAHMVQTFKPQGVGLSVTIPPAPVALRPLMAAYKKACGNTPWMVGGPGAARIADPVTHAGGAVCGSEDSSALRNLLEGGNTTERAVR